MVDLNSGENVLVIIPARGGSKGIPRKNLRSMGGKPLISYSIKVALGSSYNLDVYVCSDDAEILSISEKTGAKVIKRGEELAGDHVTLDPVVFFAKEEISRELGKEYDLVVTLQPTSPLLTSQTLDEAIGKMLADENLDTIISAVNDTHLTWVIKNGVVSKNYVNRVNRQLLPAVYKETGGFLISRSECVAKNSRIGKNVNLQILSSRESIDIDTYADWALCEYYLRRRKILFVVSGYEEIGLGHVYNTLSIANDLVDHDIHFLVDEKSQLAYEKITSHNYEVSIQRSENILDDINTIKPELVINDILDTTSEYVTKLKNSGFKVINFEDLGSGSKKADATINAIYPEIEVVPNQYFGYRYFILRDEFILTDKHIVKDKVERVLISFGGVDPNNYTYKVLKSIHDYCLKNDIEIIIILGFGYAEKDMLGDYEGVTIYKNVKNISDYMKSADVVFSSAGRTVYELASIQVPSIIMAQNSRELTHLFANSENGYINLGLGLEVTNKRLLDVFDGVVKDANKRRQMSSLMKKCDVSSGRNNVTTIIRKVISI